MEPLNVQLKNKIYLKAECLLPTGTLNLEVHIIKYRGSRKLCNVEVITASLGNHGMAIALSAKMLGVKATVMVPTVTPEIKNIESFGASIVEYGITYDDSFIESLRLSRENGFYYVRPVVDVEVLGGQSTIGIEILEQLEDVKR